MAKKAKKRAVKGSGSFRVKATGTIEYRITYKDEFGKSKRKAFSGKTEKECLEKCEQFWINQERLNRGIQIDATIPELVEARYNLDLKLNYVGIQGYSRSMETLSIIKKSPIGSIPIAYVTKQHIMLFLGSVTKYANSTIEKLFLQLKIAYKEGINKEIITTNLMEDREIRRPKSDKPDKKVRGYTVEEQKLFLETLRNHKIPYGRNNYKRQLLVELYTGLRMGEINALRPEDVDFNRRVVRVRRTVSLGEKSRPFINTTTKTYAGKREVPLSKDAEAVLREAIAEMKPNPDGLIFYDHNNMHIITTNQVNNFFRRICEKAKLEYNGQHALRHTFATRCIESHVQAVVLKNWMGHTDIHITLDTYADVFESLNNNSINQLQDYMDAM